MGWEANFQSGPVALNDLIQPQQFEFGGSAGIEPALILWVF